MQYGLLVSTMKFCTVISLFRTVYVDGTIYFIDTMDNAIKYFYTMVDAQLGMK